jgi:hypothetical protein
MHAFLEVRELSFPCTVCRQGIARKPGYKTFAILLPKVSFQLESFALIPLYAESKFAELESVHFTQRPPGLDGIQ